MTTQELPTQELLRTQIDTCLELLQRFDEVNNKGKEEYIAELYMSALLKLYLSIQQQKAFEDNPTYQDFLQSNIPPVARMQDYIVSYKMEIEDLFPPDPDGDSPWVDACWARSAFQAFLEMYHFTLETDLREKYIDLSFEDFDPAYVDDVLEDFAGRHGPANANEIPVGMPRSHWWWWGEKTEAEAA
jgi:hypothetical protein